MITVEEQKNLLLDISRQLKKEIVAYAIGGTAMMFLGLKETTKDIDLVFVENKDRKIFTDAAKKIGWQYLNPEIIYPRKENMPLIMGFGESRLDMFVKEVIDFSFSEEMQKRALVIRQFEKNLVIKIADFHDLILMKCATDRVKDIDDAKTIIENKEIDFNIIVKEAENQLSLGKERAILELGYFLEKLKKIGLKIPEKVLDRLWDLLEKQIKEKRRKAI